MHEGWWICVLRPNSVCTGCTDRQLDFTPQSPQPSHTRSLMTTRRSGVAMVPRLRLRRFSVAHSWSCSRTVTPGMSRSTCCASSIRLRSQTCTPAGSVVPAYRSVSSVVTMTRATPSASSSVTTPGTAAIPIGGWAPVMATWPL